MQRKERIIKNTNITAHRTERKQPNVDYTVCTRVRCILYTLYTRGQIIRQIFHARKNGVLSFGFSPRER